MPATRLAERVLVRLEQAVGRESDPWLRDDMKIARRIVLHAARGDAVCCSPHVLASYEVLGLHPDKVWPAILARRKALGPLDVWAAPPVPKKPAQAVKLWVENTNGARATNSRAVERCLRDNTHSVPMAAPSIAALYPNPEAPSSAKKRGFTFEEMLLLVQYSGAPGSVKAGTISALLARGRWPNEDGPVTPEICVSLLGMMLDGTCCKRTAQRRAKRACDLGFWRMTRKHNSWLPCPSCRAERKHAKCEKCGHIGSSRDLREYRRPFTYEIDVEKFRSAPRPREIRHFDARTYAEYKAAAKRGEHPNVTEMPSRKPTQPAPPDPPPATAAPAPAKQPAAEHAHRGVERISRDARQALFNAYLALKRSGLTHEKALGEVVRQFKNRFSAEDVEFALKVIGHKNGRDVTAEAPAEPAHAPSCRVCLDERMVINPNFGPGQKKLIACPECSVNSS